MSIVGLKSAVTLVFSSKDSAKLGERGPLITSQLPYAGDSQTTDNFRDTELQASTKGSRTSSSSWFSNVDPRVISDVIIGLADGLTVPFALTAGLLSLGQSKLVITGGLAELVLGLILMGLGGFLAARSELEYYHQQVKLARQEFFQTPDVLAGEIGEVMTDAGASEDTINLFLKDLQHDPAHMIDFVIQFGKGLEAPADGRQLTLALTIGLLYFFGGFIPLVPYFFVATVQTGLLVLVVVMGIALFIFGYVKTAVLLEGCSQWKRVNEGLQMVLTGGFAAGCAWGLVKLIDN